MLLPPEKVKIKRKKDEDPVEALYITSEDDGENPKKRRHTEFIFRRLQAGDGVHAQNRVVSSGRVGARGLRPEGVPQIRTTPPGEEALLDVQDDRSILYRLLAEERSTGITRDLPVRNKDLPDGSSAIGAQKPEIQRLSPSSTTSDPVPLKILQPRRFHLSKSSPVTPFPRSPGGGVQKRKKGELRNEVAIFVEKEKRKLRRPHSLLNLVTAAASLQLEVAAQKGRRVSGMSGEIMSMEGVEMPDPNVTSAPRPRRKPLISAREKRRLAEQSRLVAAHPRHHPETQKTAQTIQADPNLWDYDSPELAAELQHFVLHSINTQTQSPAPIPLKCKPKAPPARLHDRGVAATATTSGPTNNNDLDVTMQSSSDIDGDDDDDDGYVYDTYVREHRSLAPKLDPNSDGAKVGVLVISPEDREEWEAFADEDKESDKDYNSDEEDENAESFYGNDYPEDEIDPDDEFGRAAYERFRNHSTSDDEDYDAGIWSDDELFKQHPWLRREGGDSGRGAEEAGDGDEEML